MFDTPCSLFTEYPVAAWYNLYDCDLYIPGYTLFSKRRSSRGGGALGKVLQLSQIDLFCVDVPLNTIQTTHLTWPVYWHWSYLWKRFYYKYFHLMSYRTKYKLCIIDCFIPCAVFVTMDLYAISLGFFEIRLFYVGCFYNSYVCKKNNYWLIRLGHLAGLIRGRWTCNGTADQNTHYKWSSGTVFR